jgi:hypothetical protein
MAKFKTEHVNALFYVGDKRYVTSGTGFETDDKSVIDFLRKNANFTEVTDSNKPIEKPVEKVIEKPIEKVVEKISNNDEDSEIEKVKDEPETKKVFFSK